MKGKKGDKILTPRRDFQPLGQQPSALPDALSVEMRPYPIGGPT
jgi:hypothetical protein